MCHYQDLPKFGRDLVSCETHDDALGPEQLLDLVHVKPPEKSFFLKNIVHRILAVKSRLTHGPSHLSQFPQFTLSVV
jgi:hypothetical protein